MAKNASQVHEIARRQPHQVLPTVSLAQAAQALERSNQGFIPVSVNGRPQGIVTAWNLAQAVARGHDPHSTPVRAIMERKPATIHASASFEEAAQMMEEEQTRALCLCDDSGLLVGTLTLDQLSQVAPESAARVLQSTANELASIEATSAASSAVQLKSRASARSEAA